MYNDENKSKHIMKLSMTDFRMLDQNTTDIMQN